VADGIGSLEHVGALYEFVLPPETPRWPPPAERAGRPAAELAALERHLLEIKANVDLADPRVTALIAALVEHKVAVVPTLVVYRNWMLLRDLPEVQQHPDLAGLPARLREGWMRSADAQPLDPATLDLRRRQFAKLQALTGRLYLAGVELLAGTDTPVQFCPPGGAMHQELELLVAAGLSPAAALIAATKHNARAIGQADQLGTIEPGKVADLVILDADPLLDICNTRRIHRVILAGFVVDPAALLRLVPAR
jgi:imidazolonepropionase-like amidohydrolase